MNKKVDQSSVQDGHFKAVTSAEPTSFQQTTLHPSIQKWTAQGGLIPGRGWFSS